MTPHSSHFGEDQSLDADVLIVGYGPVGQSLAALLGRSGTRVLVCERREGRYETPRAGHFDHEIMRIFQSFGIADDVAKIADPAHLYEFLDVDGSVLARLPRSWDAPSGWDASYHFYQPELEEVLDSAVRAIPSVDVRFGAAVVDLRQFADHAEVVLADGSILRARFVVGADGANSIVRDLVGITTEDLGFRGDWLVADLRPKEGAPAIDIPHTGQVLDPARPNHMGRVEHRYYRWEFMLVDGDEPADMVRPERVWDLLKAWVTPDEAELIRQTVYQFRSIVAETFRRGLVLLAGDAAHVMPPFLGQGMSSGIRDAASLAWMLDLVLRGAAEERLLDLYTASRRPHVLTYIKESMRIGEIVCETKPEVAAQRRAALTSTDTIPPPFQPPIGSGFRSNDPLAGQLGVQPHFHVDVDSGTTERADEVLGHGFTLFTLHELDASTERLVASLRDDLGLRSVVIGGEIGMREAGSALTDWMKAEGTTAVLVRPDFYVFGSTSDAADVADLLAALRKDLSLT